MKRILVALALLCLPVAAFGQTQVITAPYGVTSSNSSSTVAVTNTFQSIFAAPTGSQKRAGCTIQNTGTNTMWVYFGAIAGATKGKSVTLTAGQSVSCVKGGISLQDQVSITGTATEAFFAAQQ